MGLILQAADGLYPCCNDECQPNRSHLDEWVRRIHWQGELGLNKSLVHVVDRERPLRWRIIHASWAVVSG